VVIDAHDAADDLAGVVVFGQPIDRTALFSGGAQLRIDGQHVAGLVEVVYRLPVLFALRTTNGEAAEAPAGRAVVSEPDA